MAKQLNVNLAFTSDTTKVKQDLEQLQNLLSRLTANSAQKSPLGITNEIKTAISDVSKLEIALKRATTSTGSLNLGKFKQELNQAGLSAEKISTQLIALGPEGAKAFSQLTQSIMSAEIPLKQTSTLLSNFATTLKNTARWQISSSILHGFMGSIQGAYTYAQNLNKSLNNIRIVTGKSADEMADFAEEANNAAQALSATTTEYTNASLIYYQQGLDDDAVKERTDATVKMANVTRESAEEVSQQMTAIWNNFDNGSKSLEYYSDVVTALGAATASSSAEIAQGLEKFAAAADTVGLSYEYATAALATVTATTRQSADVVGNAFKTLFSRMQGLKLGETLDDGTDLNKYSKALDAVGISIKNTDGELKQMDQILNELGSRWQSLSKDQQMALAQTVAGVRQYTQLIALMDNWDFFEQNVRVAKDAEGTLDKQFKIYEESWEAAQKRFRAAMQDIYAQILNDDFFIDLTNAFTKIIQSIGKVMDSFGGLKGLLPAISTLLLKMFGSDLSASIDRFANNIKIKFTNTLESFLQERQKFSQELQNIQSDGTITGEASVNVYQKQGELQDLLIAKVRELQTNNITLSEQEQDHINKLVDLNGKLGETKIKEAERLEILQGENEALQQQVLIKAQEYQKKDSDFNINQFENQIKELKEIQTIYASINELKNQYININNDEQGVQNLEKIIAEMQNLKLALNSDIDGVTELQAAIENLANAKGPEERKIAFEELEKQLEIVGGKAIDAFLDLKNGINGDSQEAKNLKNILDQLFESFSKLGIQIPKAAIAGNNFARSAEVAGETIKQAAGKAITASEKFVAFGSSLSSFAMTLQSINSIINTINNPDLSGWEKFLNISMSLGMIIPGIIRTWTQLNTMLGAQSSILDAINAKSLAHQANQIKENALDTASMAIRNAKNKALFLEMALIQKEEALKIRNIALNKIEEQQDQEKVISLGKELAARNLNLLEMDNEAKKRALEILLVETDQTVKEELTEAIIAEATAIQASKIVKDAETASTIANAEAEAADTAAKIAETNATKAATAANKKHAASLLANPYTWVLAALAAIAAAALIYANHLEKVAETQKKSADEASEFAKSLRDEAEAHRELIISYEELLDKYEKNEIEKSELYDITTQLADIYDIEGSAIANLTGRYDEFTKKVKEAAVAELERQKQAEKDAYKKSTLGMVTAGSEGRGNFGMSWAYGKPDGYVYEVPISFFAADSESNNIIEAIKEITGDSTLVTPTISIKDRNDPQQVIEYYENLIKLKDLLTTKYNIDPLSTTILGIDEELEQMKDYYDQTIDHIKNYNNLLLQEIDSTLNIASKSTIADVENAVEQMKTKLHAEGINISEDEIEKMVQDYLEGLNSTIVNKFLAEKELIAENINEEVANAFVNLDLSESEIEAMTRLGFKIDYYKTEEELNQAIEDYKTLLKYKGIEVSIPVNLALDINESNLKGKTINKETWEELVAAAPQTESILGERDEFNNKSIAERLRLTNELNKALLEEGIEIANLDEIQKDSYEKRKKQIDEEINKQKEYLEKLQEIGFSYDKYNTYDEYKQEIKEAEKALNSLIEKQETLNEIIEGSSYDAAVSTLSNTINSLLSDISFVQNGVELIGEDWTVAAENVEQFASLMPEIIGDIQDLQFLEDGSLKLNKEQVAMILNGNKEIIESNKEIVINSIENKIAQLQAENEFYQKQIELLKDSLQHHENYNKNLKEMDKNTQEYADQLKELGVQVDTQAWDQIIDNSAKGAEAVQQNLEKIYNRIQEIHDAYGKMLTKENLDGYDIEGVTNTSLGKGEWRASVSAEDIDKYWKPNQVEAFESQIVQYQEAIEKNEGLIASYTGAIAKIKSGSKEVGEAIDRVNSGKAGKAEKDKSSSSKNNKPDKKDRIDDEVDLYYDINNAIAKINQELERTEQIEKRLSTYQEHYAGKTLIASLKKQNELLKQKNGLLDQQYKNYEKLYDVQLQELGKLKGIIGGSWSGNELQNYAQLFQANVDKYNAVIDSYNAMSKDQQDATGKQMVEDAKKVYDKYKEALERYQDLYYNEMYDTENKLAELRQQQLENQMKMIENNLKGWEVEVELKLDMTKLKREWKAFIHDIEQDFRKIYEDLSLNSLTDRDSFNTYIEDAETRMQQIADVEAELRKMDASKDANGVVQLSDDMMFGSISEAQEKLKELQSELVDVGNNLNDMYKSVWDNYIKGLDQAKDNFEDINDELEHLTNMLEYEKELIELVYGEEAYDLMNKYYETQQRNIEARVNSTRQQAQFWEEQFNKAFEMNRDKHNVNLKDMSTWTEDMKKAYEEMIDAQEKLNDLVLEGIKNLKDEYINNIAKMLSEMDKAIWGMSLKDLKEDWDFLQKKADEYLDDVEGAYKIQALANKIDQSIADTNNLKAQEKLSKLREEEIKALREKERLTQDDIDLAEARYQIALKELALEETQNNKTSMKLSRDTSGNWTYQYVADEEDVMTKQQELLDAYNHLYEIADEAYQHAMELAIELYEEYRDKLQAIAEDTTLTQEEKLQKMQELQDAYIEEIEAAMTNAQIYEQETMIAGAAVFAEVCDQDEAAYYALTDKQKELVDAVRDNHLEDYEDIRSAILQEYDTIENGAHDALDNINDETKNTLKDLKEKAKDAFRETNINSQTAAADIIRQWDAETNNSVKGAMTDTFNTVEKLTTEFENELMHLEYVSGRTITDPGGVVEDIDNIGYAIDEVNYKTEDMANAAMSYLDDLRNYVMEVENAWEEVVSRITEAIEALQRYLDMTEQVSAEESRREAEAAARAAEEARRSVEYDSGGGSGSGSSGGSSGNRGVAAAEREQQKAGNNEGRNYWIEYEGYGQRRTQINDLTLERAQEIEKSLKRSEYFVQIHHYDTGGYTGNWDSREGRLAVLHQKELVLNASDTENMLSAVNTIRDIAGLNESINQTIASSIGQLIAKAIGGNNTTSFNTNTTNDNTSNVFNITAEFPNANDVQTIKDAILSLPNIASQYIHMN